MKKLFALLLFLLLCCQSNPGEPGTSDPDQMVYVPEGEFLMGDNFDEGDGHEKPVHPAYVDSYYIGKFEVTNGEYRRFMDAGGFGKVGSEPLYWNSIQYRGGGPSGYDNFPVVVVSWYEASAYCRWLSEEKGDTYPCQRKQSGKRQPEERSRDDTHGETIYLAAMQITGITVIRMKKALLLPVFSTEVLETVFRP